MNSEKAKVEKFFSRFLKNSVSRVLSWILISICILVIMILCMIPAQGLSLEMMGGPGVILTMITFVMLSTRVGIYNQYTENQKSRFMVDILKYHPISKKEIWKLKTKIWLSFLGKVTGVGFILQIVSSLINLKALSWLNIFYVIFYVFIMPAGGMLTFELILKKIEGDIEV